MDYLAEDHVAKTALLAIASTFGCAGGVLFEASSSHGDNFRATASVGNRVPSPLDAEFSANSLLPRWLRVNERALEIPDAIGVCDALLESELDVVRRLNPELAVPLLTDDELVAWAVIWDREGAPAWPRGLPPGLREAAAELKHARLAAHAKTRSDAVSRSNRLSVAGQMAAGIAHEVRNPLAAVRSMVQLVHSDVAPSAEHQRLLGSVLVEVDRVNGLLSGMLGLGRQDPTRTEALDLAAVALDAVGFCQSYATHRSQTIDVVPAVGLWVQGDPHELRQILVNLLLNACQASDVGQSIVVEGTSRQDTQGVSWVVVRVMDSGAGMLPSVLQRVFDPFFTTKKDGGGLGLSICRDAAQRHGGNIFISSEPAVGTVVCLELPMLTSHGTHTSR